MNKQINFYAANVDKMLIENTLNYIFGQLIDVPYFKEQFSLFESEKEKLNFYLAEKSRENDICYRLHEYYDGSTAQVLDYRKSPVMEYSLSLQSKEGHYAIGRFFCCSDDQQFSKKVSKFFSKLKKEFWYVKKWKIYMSKNIDIESSSFYIPNRIIKIEKEDLK